MRALRRIHLYLGCVFAPALIFFAVSGAWQLFGFHHGTKDGSYKPPVAIAAISRVHQYQDYLGTPPQGIALLKYFFLAAAIGLVLTTVLGVVMAFRYSRSAVPVALCLAGGIVLPVALLFICR